MIHRQPDLENAVNTPGVESPSFACTSLHWQQYPDSFSGFTWKSLTWSTRSCKESKSRWHCDKKTCTVSSGKKKQQCTLAPALNCFYFSPSSSDRPAVHLQTGLEKLVCPWAAEWTSRKAGEALLLLQWARRTGTLETSPLPPRNGYEPSPAGTKPEKANIIQASLSFYSRPAILVIVVKLSNRSYRRSVFCNRPLSGRLLWVFCWMWRLVLSMFLPPAVLIWANALPHFALHHRFETLMRESEMARHQ